MSGTGLEYIATIEEIYLQILKDISLAGISHDLNQELPETLEILNSRITVLVEVVNRNDPSRLKHWLYAIDIPESKIVSIDPTSDFYPELADLIIERTKLKILTRKNYKG